MKGRILESSNLSTGFRELQPVSSPSDYSQMST